MAVAYPYGMPYEGAASAALLVVPPSSSQGVPITQVKLPASPSSLPAWLVDLLAPMYATTGASPTYRRYPLLGQGLHIGVFFLRAPCTVALTGPCSTVAAFNTNNISIHDATNLGIRGRFKECSTCCCSRTAPVMILQA